MNIPSAGGEAIFFYRLLSKRQIRLARVGAYLRFLSGARVYYNTVFSFYVPETAYNKMSDDEQDALDALEKEASDFTKVRAGGCCYPRPSDQS